MKIIAPYVHHIECLVHELAAAKDLTSKRQQVEAALNGELSRTLRELVPLKELHASGAFFTSEPMADKLLADLTNEEIASLVALDPSCGGGNLLLAFARRLPLSSTLQQTLAIWGQKLRGIDIHEEFAHATRARLTLLAAHRGMAVHGLGFLEGPLPDLEAVFPHIQFSNGLQQAWPSAGLLLLNPPFNSVAVPAEYRWSTGKISQAALFVLKGLEHAKPGTLLRAILPDVLRSGSRYRRWREIVSAQAVLEGIQVLGQFDSKTQVDVFLLTLRITGDEQPVSSTWVVPAEEETPQEFVGNLFDVKVGRLVPYRDKEVGKSYPYLDVKHVPAWGSILPGAAHRRFDGTTFSTPFVIVRRTSKAADSRRAVATIVDCSVPGVPEQVAVENHLLVLRPKSGNISDCQQLLNVLRDPRTDTWLNEQIRCRHLTVGAVASVPYWSEEV